MDIDVAAIMHRHHAPCVAVVGTFDGVHAGHRWLVAQARRIAAARGLAVTAVTFHPRPDRVLSSGPALADLCPIDERTRLLGDAGADAVVVVPFTRRLAAMEPQRFVGHLLTDLGARLLCVGEEFALGRGRAGTVEAIRSMGVEVVCPPLLRDPDGTKVSSSRLRAARARPWALPIDAAATA